MFTPSPFRLPFRHPTTNINSILHPNLDTPHTRRRRPALIPYDSDCSTETENAYTHIHNLDHDVDVDYDYTRADHVRFSTHRTSLLPLPDLNPLSGAVSVARVPSPALTSLTLTLPTASADRLSVGGGELLILPPAPLVRLAVSICASRRGGGAGAGARTYRAAVVEGVRLKDVVRQLVGMVEAKVYVRIRGEWVEMGEGVRVSELVGERRGDVEVRIVVGERGGTGVVWEREREMGVERERMYVC